MVDRLASCCATRSMGNRGIRDVCCPAQHPIQANLEDKLSDICRSAPAPSPCQSRRTSEPWSKEMDRLWPRNDPTVRVHEACLDVGTDMVFRKDGRQGGSAFCKGSCCRWDGPGSRSPDCQATGPGDGYRTFLLSWGFSVLERSEIPDIFYGLVGIGDSASHRLADSLEPSSWIPERQNPDLSQSRIGSDWTGVPYDAINGCCRLGRMARTGSKRSYAGKISIFARSPYGFCLCCIFGRMGIDWCVFSLAGECIHLMVWLQDSHSLPPIERIFSGGGNDKSFWNQLSCQCVHGSGDLAGCGNTHAIIKLRGVGVVSFNDGIGSRPECQGSRGNLRRFQYCRECRAEITNGHAHSGFCPAYLQFPEDMNCGNIDTCQS